MHKLIECYPIIGTVATSAGEAPTPYHVTAGRLTLIGGWADLAAARALCANDDVMPVATSNGRALMAVWVGDFREASHGSHTELQLSLYVSRQPVSDLSAHPLGLLDAVLNDERVEMLCHGLWNNTPGVVAYNSEHLGLGAKLAASDITSTDGMLTFDFHNEEDGSPIVSGKLADQSRPDVGAMLRLMGLLGLKDTLALARLPWLEEAIVNRKGRVLDRNVRAQSFTAYEDIVLQWFKPDGDTLIIHHPEYAPLQFDPQFVEHMRGITFVYLDPEASTTASRSTRSSTDAIRSTTAQSEGTT